jgi:O-methyltransferase
MAVEVSNNVDGTLYLNLIKKCLINEIYGEYEAIPVGGRPLSRLLQSVLRRRKLSLMRTNIYSTITRTRGRDWPPFAHTMIGLERLDNIQQCAEDILLNNIPGDLIETGVWRGGSTIFMRAILKAHKNIDKNVWVADSFEGLPKPNPAKYPADRGDLHHAQKSLAVSLDQVKENFQKYDLLDDRVIFLKGFFCDTLSTNDINKLALIRLDGDMYESTMDALVYLYPKLSVGGYLIVDDYGAVNSCRKAVEDYRMQHNIDDQIIQIDGIGVYWQRK